MVCTCISVQFKRQNSIYIKSMVILTQYKWFVLYPFKFPRLCGATPCHFLKFYQEIVHLSIFLLPQAINSPFTVGRINSSINVILYPLSPGYNTSMTENCCHFQTGSHSSNTRTITLLFTQHCTSLGMLIILCQINYFFYLLTKCTIFIIIINKSCCHYIIYNMYNIFI